MIKRNKFSVIIALLILYLSVVSTHAFHKDPLFNIPYFDKIVHFCMYFGLMSVILIENRLSIKGTLELFLIALIPFFYGILLEILQATIIANRSGSFYDAVFNTAGIMVSLVLWLLLKKLQKSQSNSN